MDDVGGVGGGLGQTYRNADGALRRRVRGAERDVKRARCIS